VKTLRYIELKSGHSDNGPAWIGYVRTSKTVRTVYFKGRGLMKLKGQRRGESGGNYIDMQTGESFWIQVFEDAVEVSSRAYCLYWGFGEVGLEADPR
jgi:hypothetical protein